MKYKAIFSPLIVAMSLAGCGGGSMSGAGVIPTPDPGTGSTSEASGWTTHQGNASHNGYMPVSVSTSNFAKLWEWQRSATSGVRSGINGPVAGDGTVYVTTDVYFEDAAAIALDEATGTELWRVSFGAMPALNPPAINDSTLFVATSGHEDTKLWAIDRQTSDIVFQSGFDSQWGHYLAPTPIGDRVFQSGGYYGGYTYAFSATSGDEVWAQADGGSWGMDTPAVDGDHVYVHSGAALSILDKSTGTNFATITDPFGTSGYDYHGSPVKGGRNNILAYSGGSLSGLASSNAEHNDDRVISSYDLEKNEYEWSTQFTYRTFFAVAKGVIYAGRNNPVGLDAIDEITGDVLWSWTPPATDDTSFHRNIVVTDNLLFTSTDKRIYAIDLDSKKSVWSYDEPGSMAVTDKQTLLLATGATESDGRLIAFDLK